MKTMKKLICVLLALVLLGACAVCAFAASEGDPADLPDNPAAEQPTAQDPVNEVMIKIAVIGTVKYGEASKAKIDAARAGYDALSAEEKAQVKNYATLTAAEARYAELQAEAEQAAAEKLICPWDHVDHGGDTGGMLVRVLHEVLYFFAHLLRLR